ncbi:MAG TPA: hypothetical protein VGS21_02470 [Acidimicrobiales bacterium]|nr:hypothetical protein [Acidimicrobiales bacterium]
MTDEAYEDDEGDTAQDSDEEGSERSARGEWPFPFGPGFPPIDWERAIDRAREVWDAMADQMSTAQRARMAAKGWPGWGPGFGQGSAQGQRYGSTATSEPTSTTQPPPASPGPDGYRLPVSAEKNVTISGPFPLNEAEWHQLLAVLNAMKPGLVADPD